jgi:hypothetical protein
MKTILFNSAATFACVCDEVDKENSPCLSERKKAE